MSVPQTMKAILLTGHGGPEKLECREEWPVPNVAPDEVLVRVGACGINNADVWVREGAYGNSDGPEAVSSFVDSSLQFPLIQGADIAGSIAAVSSRALTGNALCADNGWYAKV